MKKRLLLIEDEPASQLLVKHALQNLFEIEVAESLKKGKQLLDQQSDVHFDLIILDQSLPDGKGIELLEDPRWSDAIGSTPVIFLTLHTDIRTKSKGFELGIYDYITKPFDPTELEVRVTAHLRRAEERQIAAGGKSTPDLGILKVNLTAQQASIENQLLELSPTEFRMLKFFVQNLDRALSREELGLAVWRKRYLGSRTIDRHVSTLRKKLGKGANYIQTVPQSGYRFSVPKAGIQHVGGN